MKSVLSYLSSLKCIWDFRMLSVNLLSFFVLAVSALTRGHIDGISMLAQAIGGVRIADYSDSLPMIPIAAWLFLISVYLLNAAVFIENEVSVMGVYVIPRYSSYRKWWMNKASQLFVLTVCFSASCIACIFVLLRVLPSVQFNWNDANELPFSYLLLLTHMVFLGTLLLCSFLLTHSRMLSFLSVIALEGSTMLVGISQKTIGCFLPGMWGMYLRSSYSDDLNGFKPAAVIAVQLVVIGVILVLFPVLLRKKGTAALIS